MKKLFHAAGFKRVNLLFSVHLIRATSRIGSSGESLAWCVKAQDQEFWGEARNKSKVKGGDPYWDDTIDTISSTSHVFDVIIQEQDTLKTIGSAQIDLQAYTNDLIRGREYIIKSPFVKGYNGQIEIGVTPMNFGRELEELDYTELSLHAIATSLKKHEQENVKKVAAFVKLKQINSQLKKEKKSGLTKTEAALIFKELTSEGASLDDLDSLRDSILHITNVKKVDINKELAKLQKKCKHLTNLCSKHKRDKKMLFSRIQELEKIIEDQKNEYEVQSEQLRAEKEEKKNSKEETQMWLRKYNQGLTTLQEERQATAEQLDELRRTVDNSLEKEAEMEEKLKEAHQSIEQIKNQKEETEAMLNDEIGYLKKEIESLNTEKRICTEKLEEIKEKESAMRQKEGTLKKDLVVMEVSTVKLQERFEKKKLESQELRADVLKLSNKLHDVQEKKKYLQEQVDSLQTEFKDKMAEMRNLYFQKMSEKTDALKKLYASRQQQFCEEYENRLSEMEGQHYAKVNEMSSQISVLNENIIKLQQEVSKLNAQATKQEEQSQQLQEENKSLKIIIEKTENREEKEAPTMEKASTNQSKVAPVEPPPPPAPAIVAALQPREKCKKMVDTERSTEDSGATAGVFDQITSGQFKLNKVVKQPEKKKSSTDPLTSAITAAVVSRRLVLRFSCVDDTKVSVEEPNEEEWDEDDFDFF